jgi:hypothetical protein
MQLKHLETFINNVEDSDANFNLALEYEAMGQTGAALSFFLRAAERATDDLRQYEALLKCALCFGRQGLRDMTGEAILQKALILLQNRPEAYFLLSRLYEKKNDWQNSYTFAVLGLSMADITLPMLSSDTEYPGDYGLYFQKGVAAWWVGKPEESREIMVDLKFQGGLRKEFAQAVDNNISKLGWPNTTIPYTGSMASQLKYQFPGADKIEKNYSQSLQDMFVLSLLNGKTNGTYVEVGSAEPFYNNNTALLEKEFDWSGVSLDIDRSKVQQFFEERNNPVFCLDAVTLDYKKLFKKCHLPNKIDYLQVDCDPPEISFQILQTIPFDEYKFAVITFEHDFYYCKTVRDDSREFLKSKGYKLAIGDVAYNKKHSYEDWWYHPDLVDPNIIESLKNVTGSPIWAKECLFKDNK